MQRRTLLTVLGAAVMCPLAARLPHARAPKSASSKVLGFLSALSHQSEVFFPSVRQGLEENGFREGQNLKIEYRFAEHQYDRLPAMAAELVDLDVDVIVAANYPSAAAAKRATKDIPIVFLSGVDPVTSALVESLNRPSGNLTGVFVLDSLIEAKRLETLRQVVSGLQLIGVLVNPTFPNVNRQITDLENASQTLGINTLIIQLSDSREFPDAFETFSARKVGGLVVTTDPFLYASRETLVGLAARHRIPAIYPFPEFAELGGLMTYGSDLSAALHDVGAYAGRILRGEKPADLPVQEATKLTLTLNLKTAKTLGLVFPEALVGRADDVIE
jgi:putative tryptophan/tyrosine transport system substrate-binding protein